MIDRIISDHLKHHKRLVIPGFGAFIRKDEDGRVVFVEFLKKDDNVLLPILAAELGVGHGAAQEALDGYVSGMKRRIEQAGSYVIDGLGVMRRTENGSYDLSYDPEARAAHADDEITPTDEGETVFPEEDPGETVTMFLERDDRAVVDLSSLGEEGETALPEEDPGETVTMFLERDDRAVVDLSSPADSEQGTVVVFDESGAEKPAPETPAERGNITSQPTVERPAGTSQGPPRRVVFTPEPGQKRSVPRSGTPPGRRKSKTDWIIIIAVLAAILALIAIVFYATTGSNPHLDIWNNAVDSLKDSLP